MAAASTSRAAPVHLDRAAGAAHQRLIQGVRDQTTPLADVDLVRRYRAGDESAFAALMARHSGLIYNIAREYFIQGASAADTRQEGCLGFYKAVLAFDLEHHFPTFAALCIRRQVLNAVRVASAKKHAFLAVYEPIENIEDPPAPEPVEGAASLWLEAMLALLTPMERLILEHRLEGYRDYADLAVVTGYSMKAIDNALQRSRRKIRQALAA